jgi:hypothetical protein
MGEMNVTKQDVDRSFRETSRKALDAVKSTAIEFMAEHPAISKVEVAKRLGRGASAIGLTMLIYEEAERTGRTREVARELLFRKIISEFPDGWYEDKKVHAAVKLGGWDYDILKFAESSADYARAVLKDLTIDNVPPTGWKPEGPDDELLTLVFDKYWPAEPLTSKQPV